MQVPAFLVFPDAVSEAGLGENPSADGTDGANSSRSRNNGRGTATRPEAAHFLQQAGSDSAVLPPPPPSGGMAAAIGAAAGAAGMAAETAEETAAGVRMPGQHVAAGPTLPAGETAQEAAEQGEPFVLLESVPHEVKFQFHSAACVFVNVQATCQFDPFVKTTVFAAQPLHQAGSTPGGPWRPTSLQGP